MSILKRFGEWLVGEDDEPGMTLKQAQREYAAKINSQSNRVTLKPSAPYGAAELPAEYDDVRFDGCKVVDGTFCRTVGEYKNACQEFYGNK